MNLTATYLLISTNKVIRRFNLQIIGFFSLDILESNSAFGGSSWLINLKTKHGKLDENSDQKIFFPLL